MHATSRFHRPQVEGLEDRQLLNATISGFVYHDANNNGLFDSGEGAIANARLELRNASGSRIATAVSRANGSYEFTTDGTISTAPATRTVLVSFDSSKTGWTRTAQVAQFDPALGTLTAVEIVNTATLTTQIQLENLDEESGELSATVNGTVTVSGPGVAGLTARPSISDSFTAPAFDGDIDFLGPSAHDSGIKTATTTQSLTLTAAADLARYTGTGTVAVTARGRSASTTSGPGNALTLVTTSAAAEVQVVYHYIPSNALRPGSYTIVETQPDGYIDGRESRGGSIIPNSVGTDSISVTLNGSNATGNNFGELRPATVSGFVYLDANNNGIKDSNETTGFGGLTMTLTGSNDLGAVTPVTVQTRADGWYSIGGLRPGTYTVSEVTQPTGYISAQKTRGNVVPLANSATAPDVISGITVAQGGTAANNNFAKIAAASLSGYVYVDTNSNGVRDAGEPGIVGVTVTLTGTNDLGEVVRVLIQTDSSGLYRFSGLRPGSYTITETQPAGYNDGAESVGSLGGSVSNDQFLVTLGQGVSGQNYNFGEHYIPVAPQVLPPSPPAPPPVVTPPAPTPVVSKGQLLGVIKSWRRR